MRICDRCRSENGVERVSIPTHTNRVGPVRVEEADLCAACRDDYTSTVKAWMYFHTPPPPKVAPERIEKMYKMVRP